VTFSRSALRAAGWTDAELRVATRNGRLVRVTRDALVAGGSADDVRTRAAAALSTQHAEAAISHRSAAVLLDLPYAPAAWSLPDQPVDLTAPRHDLTRSSRRGVRRRLASLPDADVVDCGGLRVTSVARTLVDLARIEPKLLAVQLTDAALTRNRCTPDELVAVCDRMVRVPGVLRARDVAQLARAGVDSPPETTVRLQIVQQGLPEPAVCLRIVEDGRLVVRGDLGYWEWLLWLEYDGWDWHHDRAAFRYDRSHDRWLVRRGWEVMRLHDEDVASPAGYLRQLDRALAGAPARIAALPAGLSPEADAARRLLRGA
jgi:hypothetical protein